MVLLTAVIVLCSCGRPSERAADPSAGTPTGGAAASAGQSATAAAPAVAPSPAQPGTASPASAQPPAQAAAPQPEATPAPPLSPPKPPEPKKYLLATGTTIAVRTVGEMNTKSTKSENEFEATLETPLVVDGHTVAKKGATVVGKVLNADQGGRAKGKASLTLALARMRFTNGKTINIVTDSVMQEAKSGTGKNLKRTGIMTGAGAAIGAIAGGGAGAAIGAGVGAGAGLATNLATRGPAAQIPPETVLTFSLAKDVVIVEKR
jgi:hypothetical protein